MTLTKAYQQLLALSGLDPQPDAPPELNEKQIWLAPHQLLPAVKILLEEGIYHLTTITGVYNEEALSLLYHFWSGEGLTLRIRMNADEHSIDTLTGIIPGALFYEREVAEMFGVAFKGLDTSGKFLLPDNWQAGPPMRRDKKDTNQDQEQ